MNLLRSAVSLLVITLFCFMNTTEVGASTALRVPIAGDWIATSSGDEVGYFKTDSRVFYLCRNRFSTGRLTCVAYRETAGRAGLPLMGRWAPGDTHDRPALYDPRTGWIHIYRYTDCLPDQCLGFGGIRLEASYALGVGGGTPVAGDWNASGVDSVALVRPVPAGFGEPTGSATFYSDGFAAVTHSVSLDLDLNRFSVVAGDWPSTAHVGDSLGFYDRTFHFAVLFDGLQVARLVSFPHRVPGLMAFGGSWLSGHGGIGLYSPPPPDCPATNCHRIDFLSVPGMGPETFGADEEPHPHLDSRFPDDPGDPIPSG